MTMDLSADTLYEPNGSTPPKRGVNAIYSSSSSPSSPDDSMGCKLYKNSRPLARSLCKANINGLIRQKRNYNASFDICTLIKNGANMSITRGVSIFMLPKVLSITNLLRGPRINNTNAKRKTRMRDERRARLLHALWSTSNR